MDEVINQLMGGHLPAFVKGAIFFQMLFMLAQFGLARRREYCWYALYLVVGLSFSLFVDDETEFNAAQQTFYFKASFTVTVFCYWNFWRTFFNFDKKDGWAHRSIMAVCWVQVITLLVLTLPLVFPSLQDFANRFYKINSTIVLLASFPSFFWAWKKQRGVLSILLISAAFLGNLLNFLPFLQPALSFLSWHDTHDYFFGLLGYFVETFLFSVALAVKTQHIYEENKKLEQSIVESRILALQAQMNPHFLFNCLSAINRFLLNYENDAANAYLTKFSKLVRSVLESSRQNTTSLAKELEIIRLYLEMESLRFDGQFNFDVEVRAGCFPEEILLPPFLIQPLVENAIYHGLLPKTGEKNLRIVVELVGEKVGKRLKITVRDNGVGRSQAAASKFSKSLKEQSVGLSNVRERLSSFQNLSGKSAELSLIDLSDAVGKPSGTEAVISLEL